MKERILIVDDEQLMSGPLADYLRIQGYGVSQAQDLAEARGHLKRHSTDLVLLDLTLPDGSGFSLLEQLKRGDGAPAVVVLTGNTDPDTEKTALRNGATDFMVKPFALGSLKQRIFQALAQRRKTLPARSRVVPAKDPNWAKPQSQAMTALLKSVERLAKNADFPILVTGETGVGKEYICRMIHEKRGAEGRFLATNCAELEPGLLRTDLFGHERGAFTGAIDRKAGLFELAANGTLLLDEVGDLSLPVQAALLRVLEDGNFRRLGGSKDLHSNARILAATHRDLHAMVAMGQFRSDLLYRLDTLVLRVPSLRERSEDIPGLVHHFLERISTRMGKTITLSEGAMAALGAFSWPGNIRQLRGVVERSALLAETNHLEKKHLSWGPTTAVGQEQATTQLLRLDQVEQDHIQKILVRTNHNYSAAARILGISRTTLARKLKSPEGSAAR